MKAVVIRAPGDPSVLKVEDVPEPEVRDGEVLIKVAACGVCMHDVLVRRGMRSQTSMPLIPGHEVAGTVVKLGPRVTSVKLGDRVASVQRRSVCGNCRQCRSGRESKCPGREFLGDEGLNGGYAEYVAISEASLVEIPDGVAVESAAITACAVGTELNAIRDIGKVALGETVLVTGAGGGIGIHGVQVARAAGARVVALTTSSDKVAAIVDAGAHHVVLARRGSDWAGQVRQVVPDGCDVVIDNVGALIADAIFGSLAMNGRWVLVGELTDSHMTLDPTALRFRGISILPASSTSREQLRDSLRLVADGIVRPIVTEICALEDAATVHSRMEAGSLFGRVALVPA